MKGESGEGCTVEKVTNGVKVTCDGVSQTITNGTKGSNGTSCIIASDVDGVVTLQCGEGDNSKTTKLYKAMCGTKPYDPEVKTCENQVIWGKCGNGKFNEETQFCGDDGKPYDLCGGKTYDPATQICKDEKAVDRQHIPCGKNTYDPDNNEFCDDREGENVVYKKVTITGSIEGQTYSRTWMAENLRYKSAYSKCREDDDSDCSKYGRFYTWDAVNPKGENICPDGWIMPTADDYENLVKALGEDYGKLKSQTGWKDKQGNDISFSNESGFNALPVGVITSYLEQGLDGYVTYFRTSSYDTKKDAYGLLRLSNQDKDDEQGSGWWMSKDSFYSVRCIMKKTTTN